MTMELKEAIAIVQSQWEPMVGSAMSVVLDAARAYDHHRSYIDRLQVERDERHKTCVAQANVIAELNGTIERLQSGRDEAIRALSAEKATNERLRDSRELALAELDEKVNRIALLESDAREFARLARSHKEDCEGVEADLHAELNEKVKRIAELECELKMSYHEQAQLRTRSGEKQRRIEELGRRVDELDDLRRALADAAVREQQPAADWRKTCAAMVADYTVHLSTEDLPGDTGTILEAVGFMLRWEPKS